MFQKAIHEAYRNRAVPLTEVLATTTHLVLTLLEKITYT